MDILGLWQKFSKFPMGHLIFSKIVATKIPYTGSIYPVVQKLKAGHAVVKMRDRRALRNHLKCLHAVALMNVAEFSTGLAVVSASPADARTILKSLSIEYLKKARGTITAEARQSPISSKEKKEYWVESTLRNEAGELVCRAKALWLVGPA
jgi:acyl-coenzyme A thioesterase PaaI-like protein